MDAGRLLRGSMVCDQRTPSRSTVRCAVARGRDRQFVQRDHDLRSAGPFCGCSTATPTTAIHRTSSPCRKARRRSRPGDCENRGLPAARKRGSTANPLAAPRTNRAGTAGGRLIPRPFERRFGETHPACAELSHICSTAHAPARRRGGTEAPEVHQRADRRIECATGFGRETESEYSSTVWKSAGSECQVPAAA